MSSPTRPTPDPGYGLDVPGAPRVCSIANALGVLGDRYSLLILREIRLGVRRFSDIRSNTGAPRDTLTNRLRDLENAGVIERRQYSERPPRDEYFLTAAGNAIGPVLGALREWGDQFAPPA
ncbi:winged helix-turn-helix transcriptional regulator [Streptomyces griseorubiginosus]|uniref:winged helix-turn-helix transcriptional regulator n=1 Tax=Streptomyces griseorubiginosus TaxID=67304 RepID=UPI0036EB02DC